MSDRQTMFETLYADFNGRNVEAVLRRMTENVSWPKASEGGRVVGKQAIREYWGRQWEEFNPRVEVMDLHEEAGGRVAVRVRQVVRSLAGDLLADGEVSHVYTMDDGLIARMDVGDEGDGPSEAFRR